MLRCWLRTYPMRIDPSDGYVCLTDMGLAVGKLTADFLRLKNMEDFISYLGLVMGIPITKIIRVKGGRYRDLWAYPDLAIQFAQWCDLCVRSSSLKDRVVTTRSISIE
jgi:KilA-N domain